MPPKPIIAAKLPIRLPTWRPTPACWVSSSASARRKRPTASGADPLDKPALSLTWDLSPNAEGELLPPGELSRITGIEPQQRRANRVSIFVDGAFVLEVDREVAVALGLAVGQPMDEGRLRELARAGEI